MVLNRRGKPAGVLLDGLHHVLGGALQPGGLRYETSVAAPYALWCMIKDVIIHKKGSVVVLGEKELIAAGFRRHGAWTATETGIVIDKAPATPGVYVFMLAGRPVYVGQTGHLHRRFGNYRNGDKTRRRVKQLIEAALADGEEVSVLVATPGASEWNGLPVNLVPGLESGLIQALQPLWNKSGLR